MNISARNQLDAKIVSVEKGAVNTVVTLAMPEGTKLFATVTNASAEEMGLREGQSVTAVIKATDVMLAVEGPNA